MATQARRAAKLKAALAMDDPFEALSSVREELPDDGEGAQQVVVYGMASILEINSAGMSILFERFDEHELAKIRDALEAIGASATVRDFRALEGMFATALSSGRSRDDAAEWLSAEPDALAIDRRSDSHAAEVEQALLKYCRAHVDELAAGR